MEELKQRYLRNAEAVTPAEQLRLANARVLVAGCGGLGGYILETLARVGVRHITVADGDRFEAANLNRQLFCTEQTLGCSKVAAAKKRLLEIDSGLDIKAVEQHIDADTVHQLAAGQDVILDALDAPAPRLLLLDAAAALGIPVVHGAISGWVARVHTALPGDRIVRQLCQSTPAAERWGNLSFTAAFCGALQAAEAVKLILGKGSTTEARSLECDLLHMEFDSVTF